MLHAECAARLKQAVGIAQCLLGCQVRITLGYHLALGIVVICCAVSTNDSPLISPARLSIAPAAFDVNAWPERDRVAPLSMFCAVAISGISLCALPAPLSSSSPV